MPKTLTLAEMAAEQGVDTSALRHAIRRGHLVAAQEGGVWRVTRAEANRYARRTGPAPAGYLTATEAARRLGRTRQRVHQMIADGKLPAKRTRDGRVFIPADAVGGTDARGSTGAGADGAVRHAGGTGGETSGAAAGD